ncbi:S-layer homology domain-containing protein [Patescibacteria group bacterium]|nr:S-layer homology domain-containing protein [Patescibacteria group bacterium]
MDMKKLTSVMTLVLICTMSLGQSALASFTDVPESHENYQAITYLQSKGIIQGYEDGTFRPDQEVVRAEAVKIIIAPLFQELPESTVNPFPDVAANEWFAKYVEKAKEQGVVSGDGDTGNFVGGRYVNLVEYLKILLLAYKVNLDNYHNQTEIIFNDVTNLGEWFIPYVYYASTTNLIHADSTNNIYPGQALTRAEVAEITYRLIINIKGGEVQLYLSMAESEMIKILQYIEANNIDGAEASSIKAVSYTDQAKSLSPDETIVQAAHKIALAFDELVKGYRAGIDQNLESAQTHASSAWGLAEEAKGIDASVAGLALKIQDIAHAMAEEARA